MENLLKLTEYKYSFEDTREFTLTWLIFTDTWSHIIVLNNFYLKFVAAAKTRCGSLINNQTDTLKAMFITCFQ